MICTRTIVPNLATSTHCTRILSLKSLPNNYGFFICGGDVGIIFILESHECHSFGQGGSCSRLRGTPCCSGLCYLHSCYCHCTALTFGVSDPSVLKTSVPIILKRTTILLRLQTDLPLCFLPVSMKNFVSWRNSPSGPRPPHCRGFIITLRHATLSTIPLDE